MTEELRAEYHSLFELYDRDCDGLISHQDFFQVVMDAGIELGQEDLVAILEGQPADITPEIFTDVLSKCCVPPYNAKDVQGAFKVFDPSGSGKANYAELEQFFKTLGAGFSDKMVQGFLQLSHQDATGNIDYMDFSQRLMANPDPNEVEHVYVEPVAEPETEEEIMAVIETVEIDMAVDISGWCTHPEGCSIEWGGFFMKGEEEVQMVFQHMEINLEGVMTGKGSDADGTEFTIEGALAGDKTFTFKKVCGEVTVEFSGVMEGHTFKGKMKPAEGEEQDFELTMSGSVWSGWYICDPVPVAEGEEAPTPAEGEPAADAKHDMELALAVSQDNVFGNGTDDVGAFLIHGTWSEQTGDFNFVKKYIGAHQLLYFGKSAGELGGMSVRGKYGFDENTHGKFMLKEVVDEEEA